MNEAAKKVGTASGSAQEPALTNLAQARANVDWNFATTLNRLVDAQPALAERYAGPAERLLIEARRADSEWNRAGDTKADRLAAAKLAQPHLTEALRQAHLMLLPRRVGLALVGKPVAGSVALDGLFPGDVTRAEATRVLSQGAPVYPGVVDAERGLVYRTARTAGEKLAYLFGAPLLAFLAGVVLFWVVGHLDEWTSVDIPQLKSTRDLLEVYVLVTVGALLHLAVSVRKARTASPEDAVPVSAGLLDWAHVRAVHLCALVVPIVVTVLVVRLTDLRIEGTEDWAIAILAGYSSDSIAQLGFDRLNKAVEVFAAKAGSPSA